VGGDLGTQGTILGERKRKLRRRRRRRRRRSS
jgi:hypothetical protein